MKKRKVWIILVVMMVILLVIIIFRPDIDLAMTVIENTRDHPEDDWQVKLARGYLITFENPKTYDQLNYFLENCSWIKSPTDPPDYRQMVVVEILGEYKSPGIVDKMSEIVMRDYSSEPFIQCTPHAVDVLGLKGDEGYDLI